MKVSFENIKEQLQKSLEELNTEAEATRKQLTQIESDMAKAGSALAAFDGTDAAIKSSSKRKPPKCSADVPQLVEHIADELKKVRVLSSTELSKRIQHRLANEGYSRIRFVHRFEEACKSSRFVEGEHGLGLKVEVASATSSSTPVNAVQGISVARTDSSFDSTHMSSKGVMKE